MASTDLATQAERPARVVRYQRSQGSLLLPSELEALDSTESVLDFPLLTPSQMALAKRTVEDLRASLEPAGPDHVRKIFASLAYLPHKEKGEEMAQMMLADFISVLQAIPRDVLDRAREKVAATARFFPTPSEFKAHCTEHARRAWLLSRVQMMIRRGVRPDEPRAYATREEIARIKAEVASSFAPKQEAAE